jgi:hypothetical protein
MTPGAHVKELLSAVVAWIERNKDLAKQQFSESAAEVIECPRSWHSDHHQTATRVGAS